MSQVAEDLLSEEELELCPQKSRSGCTKACHFKGKIF